MIRKMWYLRLFLSALNNGFSLRGAAELLRCEGYEEYRKEGYSPLEALQEDLSYA